MPFPSIIPWWRCTYHRLQYVTSRFEYCNSMFVGMSVANFNKLHRVKNTLAKVILQQNRLECASPLLRQLHWLHIKQRVTYKVATITFNLLKSRQPGYLHKLIQRYTPNSQLLSSNQHLLSVDRTWTVFCTAGLQTFCCCHSTELSQQSWTQYQIFPEASKNSPVLRCFQHHLLTVCTYK